ncbi:MAG: NADH-quinone oxidoreductase subunit N [Candidatus Latescibacterota bacterium]|jgi:NADH-quinone oxidoreductase subunit N
MTFPVVNGEVLAQLLPLILLVVAGCLFLMWGAMSNRFGKAQSTVAGLFLVGLLVMVASMWNKPSWPLLGGMLVVDKYTLFFTGVIALCALATVLTSVGYMKRFGIGRSEWLAMMFFSVSGMFVLVSAVNLVAVFIGIELMSIPIYVLVASRRRDFFANEAALKYFILGAFAIAFFLYGMSLLYGLLGTLNFKSIVLVVADRAMAKYPPFLLAVGLVMVGFVFKIAAVPFHMWVPDVYQGAPSPVTGFMAAAVKAASFAAFLRIFYSAFMPGHAHWVGIVIVLSVLTMTIGNITALVQRNIKRMLAYSSIAHAGYILIGIAALSLENTKAASTVMFYATVYAFMTLGAFATVTAVERAGDTRGLEIDDYAGLGVRKPFLGFAMALFMFALAGIPPTAGFFAKYYVFSAAVSEGLVWLVVVGVLNSALSLYYYLRVVVVMYFKTAEVEAPVYDDLGIKVVLIFAVFLAFWLGLGPGGVIPGIENVLDWTNNSLLPIVRLK